MTDVSKFSDSASATSSEFCRKVVAGDRGGVRVASDSDTVVFLTSISSIVTSIVREVTDWFNESDEVFRTDNDNGFRGVSLGV